MLLFYRCKYKRNRRFRYSIFNDRSFLAFFQWRIIFGINQIIVLKPGDSHKVLNPWISTSRTTLRHAQLSDSNFEQTMQKHIPLTLQNPDGQISESPDSASHKGSRRLRFSSRTQDRLVQLSEVQLILQVMIPFGSVREQVHLVELLKGFNDAKINYGDAQTPSVTTLFHFIFRSYTLSYNFLKYINSVNQYLKYNHYIQIQLFN